MNLVLIKHGKLKTANLAKSPVKPVKDTYVTLHTGRIIRKPYIYDSQVIYWLANGVLSFRLVPE